MRLAQLLCVLLLVGTVLGQEPKLNGSNLACITSVKNMFPPTVHSTQPLPTAIRQHVPSTAFVTLILPLSSSDTLTIYELGNWARHWANVEAGRSDEGLTDPDTRFLVTRDGKPVFQYAMKELLNPEGHREDWGLSSVAMSAAHLCADSLDLTYLILQTGNSGGFYFALQRVGDEYRLIPISDAYQGRLVLTVNHPGDVEVWSADDIGVCGACAKPFVIKRLRLDGSTYRLISQRTTRKRYGSFQDEPLVVKP